MTDKQIGTFMKELNAFTPEQLSLMGEYLPAFKGNYMTDERTIKVDSIVDWPDEGIIQIEGKLYEYKKVSDTEFKAKEISYLEAVRPSQ